MVEQSAAPRGTPWPDLRRRTSSTPALTKLLTLERSNPRRRQRRVRPKTFAIDSNFM